MKNIMEMKHDPFVSVIIPNYNNAKFITEAIDSVLAQTYKNYEIIVVDDGSTDGTREVLEPYIKKKQIRYVYQKNKKQAVARNNGIKYAKGELIAFLDADDLWFPKKLELQVPLFKNKEVGLIYGDILLLRDESTKPSNHTDAFDKGNIFNKLLMGNFICTSTTIIRKECFDKVGLFKEGMDYFGVEDYHMWLRISYYFKVDYVSDVLLKYRLHDDNTSKDYCGIVRREINVRKDISNIFNIPKKLKNDCLFDSYFRLSYFLIENSKYKIAFNALLNAFLLKPFNYKNYKLFSKILYKLIKKIYRVLDELL